MGQIQCRQKYQVFKEGFVTYLFIAWMSIAGVTDWLFVSSISLISFFWLAKLDKLLLGLWKSLHCSALKCSNLTEIQKAYSMKALHLLKAVATRWLSHGAACKRCLERYKEILEALDQVLVAKPNPGISGYRSDFLEPSTVLQLSL